MPNNDRLYTSNADLTESMNVLLTGSNVPVILQQLYNAQVVGINTGIGINFDISKAKNAQVWIAIDRSFDLTFYPMMDVTSNNMPSLGTQALATNIAAPPVGRTAVFAITALPSPAGRLLITNKDVALSATVSLWIAYRNN